MENSVIKNNKPLKCGAAIKTLSIISLVCMVLYCHIFFFYWDEQYIMSSGTWKIIFAARPLYDIDIISFVLTLAPSVLFVIYLFGRYDKSKATVLVTAVISAMVLRLFLDIVPTANSLQRHSYYFRNFNAVLVIIPVIAMGILGIVGAIKGFNKKGLIVPAMVLSLLLQAASFMGHFLITRHSSMEFVYVDVVIELAKFVGASSLYVALLLFGLKGGISDVIPVSLQKEKAKIEKMDPEQALKLLKYKLDLDMITEEEYQAQRAEIINKL